MTMEEHNRCAVEEEDGLFFVLDAAEETGRQERVQTERPTAWSPRERRLGELGHLLLWGRGEGAARRKVALCKR